MAKGIADQKAFAVVFSIADVTEDPVTMAVSMAVLAKTVATSDPPRLTELLIGSDFEVPLSRMEERHFEQSPLADGAWPTPSALALDSSKSATVFVNEPLDGDWMLTPWGCALE